MNLGWLLLVLGLEVSEASCCLLERVRKLCSMSQDQLFTWKSSSGGAESLGISQVRKTVLARLRESQIWHQVANSVGGGFRKEIMASAHLDARDSVLPCMPLVPFKLPPQCWSSEGMSLTR